jgi:hypothetical protein
MEVITEAFRWTNYLHWSVLIDVSDVISTPEFAHVPRPKRARRHADIIDAIVGGKQVSQMNMDRLVCGPVAEQAEFAALLDAVTRIIWFFMAGGERGSETGLVVIGSAMNPDSREQVSGSAAVLRLEADWQVSLHAGGRTMRRRSRLVWRLGAMLADAKQS